ncbi:unnamed protein product, partial [Timema podura]|nr:unnamed protein product [Timema podura]
MTRSQRKSENETEVRRKAETILQDMKRKLEEEQNKRTREMNNNQHVNDKINLLEKQLTDMQEKLKGEAEGASRLRKQIAELTIAKSSSEQIQIELQGRLATLQSQRDVLQQEVATLQGHLSQERSSRTHASDLQQELEGRSGVHELDSELCWQKRVQRWKKFGPRKRKEEICSKPFARLMANDDGRGRLQSLHGELERTKQREGKLSEDNRLLGEKVSTLEKECAGLGLKLKAAENRLEQELRAHEETERRSLVSKEEANLEVVKGVDGITNPLENVRNLSIPEIWAGKTLFWQGLGQEINPAYYSSRYYWLNLYWRQSSSLFCSKLEGSVLRQTSQEATSVESLKDLEKDKGILYSTIFWGIEMKGEEVACHGQLFTTISLSHVSNQTKSRDYRALQAKLNEEKLSRQRADSQSQEKERQMSMLNVDYRQIQQRLQKLEGEHRQENEKVKTLQCQVEQEQQKKCSLQSELSVQVSEVAHLRARETQLTREVTQLREGKRSTEEELHKVKTARSVDNLQMKELQDQLEAEQYFSTLYKTQAQELKEDLEERQHYVQELEEERGSLKHQLQIALARADSEALARSIAEETVADLEKEKTMKELEHKDLQAKHRTELANKEIAFNTGSILKTTPHCSHWNLVSCLLLASQSAHVTYSGSIFVGCRGYVLQEGSLSQFDHNSCCHISVGHRFLDKLNSKAGDEI